MTSVGTYACKKFLWCVPPAHSWVPSRPKPAGGKPPGLKQQGNLWSPDPRSQPSRSWTLQWSWSPRLQGQRAVLTGSPEVLSLSPLSFPPWQLKGTEDVIAIYIDRVSASPKPIRAAGSVYLPGSISHLPPSWSPPRTRGPGGGRAGPRRQWRLQGPEARGHRKRAVCLQCSVRDPDTWRPSRQPLSNSGRPGFSRRKD